MTFRRELNQEPVLGMTGQTHNQDGKEMVS